MKMTNFQIIVTGIFVALILLGVGVFALSGGLNGGGGTGPVVVWGTMSGDTMQKMLQVLSQTDKSFQSVTYIQKNADTYEADLINAMASGSGPDLFLLPQEDTAQFANKISIIPYSAVSQSTFTNSYIDEGQLFLTAQGALALPFTVDPLVLYWNRDLFATAGLAQPPQYWSDVLTEAPKLSSIKPNTADVSQGAIALGEWPNIAYAKDILATLFLQAGDPIISYDQSGQPQAVFGSTPQGAPENPATSALTFYTDFANPSKQSYSWNHSLPEAQDAFVAGTIAMYVGFASDNPTIAARNPNLHFAVSLVPQIQGNATTLTFGRLVGLAISRTASNPAGALTIAEKLAGQPGVSALASVSPLPPVRRDVSLDTSSNAAATVFAQSALIARAWYDPNPASTDTIFKSMVESVVSGQNQPDQAVSQASQQLSSVLHNGQ